MSKLKKWLINKFLPAYCRDELLAANANHIRENEELRQEIARLRSYISGMDTAMRNQRRLVIRNEVKKD